MANATSLPTYTNNKFFFWNAKLTDSLDNSTSDQTVNWDTVPVDENGTTITGAFLMACRNTRKNPNRTELMWVPASAVAADGLSATGVIRGLKPSGLDFTTGSSSFVYEFDSGDEIFCAILPQDGELLRSAINGTVATGGVGFTMGTDAGGETVTLYRTTGAGTKLGFLRWYLTSSKVEFSNDGSTWQANSDVSASVLVKVTSSDTTASYLNDKIDVATDGELTKAIGSSGANETLRLGLATSMTKAEMDQLAGISANVTDTNLNILTAGSASNADSLHTHTNPAVDVVAAEAIDGSTTPQPLAMLGNNHKKQLFINGTGVTLFSTSAGSALAVGDIDGRTRWAQQFSMTDDLVSTITLESVTVLLDKVGTPTDNFYAELYTDSAGVPGTLVTNGTSGNIAGGSLTTTMTPKKLTFSTPPTITSGTSYWIVFRRSDTNNAANYFQVRSAGADVYGSNAASYTASTTTWSTTSTDIQLCAIFNYDYNGKACIADGNAFPRTKFFGFTSSDVAADGTLAVVNTGNKGSFSGVSGGATYWLDTTQGQLTTTEPSLSTSFGSLVPRVRVGMGIGTTNVHIDPYFEAQLTISSVYATANPIVETGSQSAEMDLFIETGFCPKHFTVRYTLADVAGSGTDDRYYVAEFLGTTVMTHFQLLAAAFSPAAASSAISVTDTGYAIIQEIKENGFILRIKSENTNEVLSSLSITARG